MFNPNIEQGITNYSNYEKLWEEFNKLKFN